MSNNQGPDNLELMCRSIVKGVGKGLLLGVGIVGVIGMGYLVVKFVDKLPTVPRMSSEELEDFLASIEETVASLDE